MAASISIYTVQSEPNDVFVVPVQLQIHSTPTAIYFTLVVFCYNILNC